MVDWASMKACMTDARCSEAAIERAERLYHGGSSEELIRCLRACRCDILEAIHVRQKQLDHLDQLIREAKDR